MKGVSSYCSWKKTQLISVFEWRKSVHYWWNSILFFSRMQRVNQHARPSIIHVGCPTCCYQVCALDHANVGTADLDYSSGPWHRNDMMAYQLCISSILLALFLATAYLLLILVCFLRPTMQYPGADQTTTQCVQHRFSTVLWGAFSWRRKPRYLGHVT